MLRTGLDSWFDFSEPAPTGSEPVEPSLLQRITDELMKPASKAEGERLDAEAAAKLEAAQQDLYELQTELRRLSGLGAAPLGALAIGGAALMALGWSGTGGWMQLLRWGGGATLTASLLIAVKRALA